MPPIDIEVTCPVFDSFRVQQVSGMFDVPLAQRASQRFHVDVPDWVLGSDECGMMNDEWPDKTDPAAGNHHSSFITHPSPWSVGLIVGPSGSGKSTIARALFADRVYRPRQWPTDRAVIDGLGARPIKEITRLFTAVGFSSPPSWIKPYQVLSNGEQFRCDLARALMNDEARMTKDEGDPFRHSSFELRHSPLVVFDEFTSVVDRNVARIVSAAVCKGIRSGQIACRLVAVTCHYDVTEWLAPDWIIDMATATFTRRSLRRPAIELEVFRCGRSAWRLFARHHYLSGMLSPGVRCFLATWRGEPVAFCATLALIGRSNRWRISRVVVLPDYQGVGIGMAVAEAVAELHGDEGHRVSITARHPAVIAHCQRSERWQFVRAKKAGVCNRHYAIRSYRGSAGRAVMSFEYVGEGSRTRMGNRGMANEKCKVKSAKCRNDEMQNADFGMGWNR
jgi:GNAT superfamily N-acetyltransferase